MGKTSKPLTILAFGGVEEWEEVKALEAQGHEVERGLAHEGFDIILGPTAWRMGESTRKYLKLAIAEARRLKYGGKTETTEADDE